MSQKQAQDVQTHSSPKLVFERMIQATNRHDLEAMVAILELAILDVTGA